MTHTRTPGWVDETCLQALGLKRQPFTGANGSFYQDTSRARQITVARERLWAGGIILVSAPSGYGKTALLDWLGTTTDKPAISKITAHTQLSVSDLVDTIAPHRRDDGPVSPWVVLRSATPQPALAIDDGERLPLPVVKRLAGLQGTLAEHGLPLPMIIACNADQAEGVYESLNERRNPRVELETLTLAPFNLADTGAYLRLRLAEASGDDTGLSERQIERVHRRSGGIPARIDAAAARALERTARRPYSARFAAVLPTPTTVPGARRAALALGITAVGLAGTLLWWHSDWRNESPSNVRVTSPQKVNAAEPSDQTTQSESGDSGDNMEATTPSGAPAEGEGDVEGGSAQASADDEHLKPLVPEEIRLPGGNPTAESSDATTNPGVNSGETTAETGNTSEGTAEANDPVSDSRVATTERDEPTTRSPAEAEDVDSGSGVNPAQLPDFQLDTQWFGARTPKRFTVQLLGARKPVTVRRFLSNASGRNVRIVLSERDGEPWYAIVTGDYAERAAAKKAIGDLPADWQELDPFPRTFKSLQPGS